MLMHPTQITLKCSKHIPKKKKTILQKERNKPKNKRLKKVLNIHSCTSLTRSCVDTYLHIFGFAFPLIFGISLHSEVYFRILLLFNLLVYCSLLRSLPRLPVSSFKHTVASSWLLHLKTQDLRRSDWAFPTHRWLKMLFELSDFFLKAHGMFNYVDISGLQCL